MGFKFSRPVGVIIGLLILLWLSFDVRANIEGQWIQHPAACLRSDILYSQVDRIIDGDRYVYFSVRGHPFNRSDQWRYNTGTNTYGVQKDIDPIQIFRYDKTLPWEDGSIRALAQEFELSGSLPVALNYSPARGVLAVAYDNKAIDFIFDSGKHVTSSALKSLFLKYGEVKIFSFTFDDETPCVYVAGSFGYVCIDIESGEAIDSASFGDTSIAWACRIGDYMVVVAGTVKPKSYDTQTYVFPADEVPATLTNPIIDGSNIQYLMPLSHNTFAAMMQVGSSETQSVVGLFIIDEGTVSLVPATSTGTVDNGAIANYRHMFRTDGYVSPARDGFLVSNNSFFHLIHKGIDFEDGMTKEEYKNMVLSSVSKSALESSEKNAKMATFDGSKVWFYTYDSNGLNVNKRGFYNRSVSPDGSWGEKSDIVGPNAPTSTFASYSLWTPEHGLITRGPGSYFNNNHNGPDFLCAYKDGKWTDLAIYSNYAANSYLLPTNIGRYIEQDPLNPNLIWGASRLAGLHRLDLGDYSNFFAIGSDNYNSYASSYPGYFPLMKKFPLWTAYINFTNVDFDINGTMWVNRASNFVSYDYDYEDQVNAFTSMYYFTKEQREEWNHVSHPSYNLKLNEIRVSGGYTSAYGRILAMKAPGNENYIVSAPLSDRSEYKLGFIYDHNGTPENTEDDRVAFFSELYDETGKQILYFRDKWIYEDEDTGEFWLCLDNGPFIFNPTELLEGRKVGRRLKTIRREGVESEEYPLEEITINGIVKDPSGRKWIATENGLYCLSADNSELLGHYTTENSRILDNEVLSVSCDGSTGAVFALTTLGLSEFVPTGSGKVIPEGKHLSIWPSTVTPDYKGYISISGAESGSEYVVYDSEGNEVVSLGTANAGVLQWNMENNDGKKASPGRYYLGRRGYKEENKLIIL